jgi:hypothetical protein
MKDSGGWEVQVHGYNVWQEPMYCVGSGKASKSVKGNREKQTHFYNNPPLR